MKSINIGICGLGTVGYGSFSVLKNNSSDIARRVGAEVKVTHIGARRLRAGLCCAASATALPSRLTLADCGQTSA